MTATTFDPDESVTPADMDSLATSVAKSIRESIAANVEALGCMVEGHRGVGGISVCTTDPRHLDHHWSCPLTIAAAIREGRL